MENNVNKNILNVLQEVLDKIEKLPKNNDTKSNLKLRDNIITISEGFVYNYDTMFGQVKKQQIENRDYIKGVKDVVLENKKAIDNKVIKTINNTTEEFFLFGKDSKVSLRFISLMLILITIVFSSFKFLPKYYSNYNEMKKEKETYQIIYNYLYLTEFKNDYTKSLYLEELKSKIKNNDKSFFKNYNSLKTEYDKEIKKQKLLEQLKSMQ